MIHTVTSWILLTLKSNLLRFVLLYNHVVFPFIALSFHSLSFTLFRSCQLVDKRMMTRTCTGN